MSVLTKKIIKFAVIGIITAALIVGNVICAIYEGVITTALCGTGISFEGEDVENARKAGDELCQQLMEDGMVLFKNENNALPLSLPAGKDKIPVNVFGWSAIDEGFLLRGIGSGSSTIMEEKKVTLLSALSGGGFEYNNELINMYKSFRSSRSGNYTLIEPPASSYNSTLMTAAKDFSDTAIVVFSRNGGENIGEIPSTQTRFGVTPSTDDSRTYLQTSKEEDALLKLVSENFGKVIVIINSANIMHLDFLDDDKVDAAFFVGLTGQSGTKAIAKLLKGEINPSGRTSDIYTYDPKADPAWANREKAGNHIQYVEDIYYGYKWYETADVEGYLDDPDYFGGLGYDGYVQFPFGYGKSYTNFEWTVDNITIPSPLTKTSKIEITMAVKNIGTVSGKDVIQVYYTPPYVDGKIEKAHVNLAAFAKTVNIEPGQTQQNIKLSFTAFDMASYDCYDKNTNGFSGYELDRGSYQIKIMRDSHTVDTCEDAVTTFTLESPILFDKDPATGVAIQNRFTGDDAYAGVPIDGSTVGAEVKYLTRANGFTDSFPTAHAKTPSNLTKINEGNTFTNNSYDQTTMPDFGIESNLRLVQKVDKASGDKENATYNELNGSALPSGKELIINDELMMELGTDYDNSKWDDLLNQLTKDEVKSLVESSGFRTRALESVGKPRCLEYDGPAGFNMTTGGTEGAWTAYPSETLIGCTFSQQLSFSMGIAMGVEAAATGLNGWYAPGVNLHRTQYTARNFEYYGEDGVHSGKMAAQVIRGAKANGLYCYIKHFVVSEPGPNPRELNTWLTEQNLRENYLRPFEIAVKEGGANAMMTAFNRVGAVWAGACYALNVSILREEWGFRGAVITDWSTGDGYMNPTRGVRAGNDIWLNPNSTNGAPLSLTNPTDMYCAKNAAKNVLYMYANTYAFNKTFDFAGEDVNNKVEVGVRTTVPVFPWWIPLLVVIDVLVAAGLGFWVFMIVRPKKSV